MTLAERLASLTWGGAGYPAYEGRLDRAAQGQAKNAANTAANVAGTEESAANAAGAALTPFYRQEMNAQHLYNPAQTQELLNYAGAGTGGAASAAAGEAASQAARTRNTSGFSSSLDQIARERMQQMAKANAGIGAQDVMGAKELNQAGAAGMQGLYNTDTSAMLAAMGQIAPDVNAETNAGKSGWFQNTLSTLQLPINALSAFKGGGPGNTPIYSG